MEIQLIYEINSNAVQFQCTMKQNNGIQRKEYKIDTIEMTTPPDVDSSDDDVLTIGFSRH
jgi:hypothetical protein